MSITASGGPRTLKRRKNHSRSEKLTVGQYLLKRLSALSLSHFFVAPHPCLESLTRTINEHPKITLVSNPSVESCAEMADGYGKAKGIAAIAISGHTPKALDILMRAYSESVPQVVVFGKRQSMQDNADEGASILEKLFRQHSASWTELSDPLLAAKKIDRVLDYCIFFKKPVCIELPDEVVDCFIPQHVYHPMEFGVSDPDTLDELLLELESLFNKAKHPLIHLDRDVVAHKAESLLLHFAERWHIPITSSHTAKNFLLESHPNYCGSLTEELVARADLVCVLGKEHIPLQHKGHNILIGAQDVYIDNRVYPQLLLREVLAALCGLEPHKRHKLWQARTCPDSLLEDVVITCRDKELLDDMAPYFTGDVIASDVASPHYSLAAAIGAAKALPRKRPIVLLDETDLRSSLTELYIAHEECLPLLICVAGNGSWIKGLFPDIPVYRRRIPEVLPYELVVVSLE